MTSRRALFWITVAAVALSLYGWWVMPVILGVGG